MLVVVHGACGILCVVHGYAQILDFINEEVHQRMLSTCGMVRDFIGGGDGDADAKCEIFVSSNWKTCSRLLVLVQGTRGVVNACPVVYLGTVFVTHTVTCLVCLTLLAMFSIHVFSHNATKTTNGISRACGAGSE